MFCDVGFLTIFEVSLDNNVWVYVDDNRHDSISDIF